MTAKSGFDDDSDARMLTHPPRMVRAIHDCYVEHVYRRAGDTFLYHGAPNPRVYQEQPGQNPPEERSVFAQTAAPGLVAASRPTTAADQSMGLRKAKRASPSVLD